ncbi:MAG: DNA (cytosine-5-)-methyltransferase [Candidatus Moranbacteria bacterium]|nr:DNA (cytosine-5-)-methyltransferase [Candidatus Moranbacteria bacterium]
MKILSLFDGISCARVALERIGVPVEAYYASEIDKYAIQISQKNYPDTIHIGSVLDINSKDYKDIDLLIGGSPCQDLSIAKKNREGLKGERSGLFYEYVRILNEVKPKFFILENVNSMPKEAKETITKELFGIEPVMINAALVSAQNRKRLFWVGKLVGNTYVKVDVPLPEDKGILLRDILEPKVDERYFVKAKSNTIRTSGRGSGINDRHNWDTIRIGEIGKGGQGDRIYSPKGKSTALSALGGGRGAKTGLYLVGLIDGKNSQGKRVYSPEGKSTTLGAGSTAGGESGRRTGLYAVALTKARTEEGKRIRKEMRNKTGKDFGSWKPEHIEYVPRNDEKANTITTGLSKEGFIQADMQIRKLTPIECERLQGLKDGHTEGVSNTQRYKALGNAFNVDVVSHILRNIL